MKSVEVGRVQSVRGSDGDDLKCTITVTALDGQKYTGTFLNVFDAGPVYPREWPQDVLAAAAEKLPADMRGIRL